MSRTADMPMTAECTWYAAAISKPMTVAGATIYLACIFYANLETDFITVFSILNW